MVTKLYFFANKRAYMKWCRERGYDMRACEAAWTGPGWYYARKKDHISKHVVHLDVRRGRKEGKGPWRHTHDIEQLIRRVKRATRKTLAELVARQAPKRAPERVKRKLAKAVEARALARAARRARTWTRNKAVRDLAKYLWAQIPKKYKEGREKAWTYIAVLALAKAILERAKEKGVDPYQYDWAQLIDWSLGYGYAVGVVQSVLGKTQRELAEEAARKLRYYERLYGREKAARKLEEELDAIAKYELDHLDDWIGW